MNVNTSCKYLLSEVRDKPETFGGCLTLRVEVNKSKGVSSNNSIIRLYLFFETPQGESDRLVIIINKEKAGPRRLSVTFFY